MTATTPRARLPRTLAALASHPWVESIDDARGSGDGLHVYLRPGFVWAGTTSAVIEPTVKACCEAFREVMWDPQSWGQACGASAAEVAALIGEAAPAPAAPAEAAPAPAARRRLNPLAEMLLTRLQATDRDWLVVEVCPIVGTLKGLGWIVTRHDYGTGVECQITIHGRHALAARPCDGDAAPAPRPTLPAEAAPAEAAPAPSIADVVAEASAALNAEGEAATARVFNRLGRIRTGLIALADADAAAIDADARPVLPGEATPPRAPSHGDRAPRLPELYPATSGTPTRAEAVRDVERRDGGGVAVICSDSPREAFRLPDTVSHCGAAAALEAAGWILSPELEALARRWRDISGDQEPSAEAVAIAEAAAPRLKRFEVFHRTWWRAEGVPGVGPSRFVAWANTEAHARHLCRRWNAAHLPGPLSDRAEYTAA